MDFKLIIKKLNNSLNKSEEINFYKWYNESKSHKEYFDRVQQNFTNEITNVDIKKGWEELERKITTNYRKKQYWKYGVAASIVVLISIGFIFDKPSNNPTIKQVIEPVIVNTKIEMGTDKAVLTLDDGTNIILDDDQNYKSNSASSNGKEIVYNSNTDKKPKQEIKYNTLTIPRGGQYFVTLEDGTNVWLNSESQLKYPVNFMEGETRMVELIYGEAYFDVSSSENHNGSKFKVLSSGVQEIEVLGTEFNIKAYNDEDFIYTTLVEGKVNVYNVNDYNLTLKPNEQSVLNKASKDIVVLEVDVNVETAWREGIFSFKSKSLEDIMKVLSRWYDVEITFLNQDLKQTEFKGVLSKHQDLEQILTIITNTKFINAYEINEKTILIK